MHLEADSRVAFGANYDAALKAMVRVLEPNVEEIRLGIIWHLTPMLGIRQNHEEQS
jgi:hypothetical protein